MEKEIKVPTKNPSQPFLLLKKRRLDGYPMYKPDLDLFFFTLLSISITS